MFEDCPLAYEHLRHVIATALEIPAKHVCLTGSARLGFATPIQESKDKRWGTLWVDTRILFAVDGDLFSRCLEDVRMIEDKLLRSNKAHHLERIREEERWSNKVANLRKGPLRRVLRRQAPTCQGQAQDGCEHPQGNEKHCSYVRGTTLRSCP